MDIDVDLAEVLGISKEEQRAYSEALRGCCDRKNGDPLDERPCPEGRCIELVCPCGTPSGMGWGPVDCPCQDDS